MIAPSDRERSELPERMPVIFGEWNRCYDAVLPVVARLKEELARVKGERNGYKKMIKDCPQKQVCPYIKISTFDEATDKNIKDLQSSIASKDQGIAELRGSIEDMKEQCHEIDIKNGQLQSQLSRMSKSAGVENLLEKLPDMLAEAQVETIPNSAIYDVDVRKLAQAIHDSIMGVG